MTTELPAMRLERVSARRGSRIVLHDVSIDVRAGECVALVGPNGAGKSTAVAVGVGDLPASEGRVLLFGRDRTEITPKEQARVRSVMTQQVTVAFGFTVREVVSMGREPWRARPEAERDDEAIANALREADIEDLADRPCQSLSGGEQARVALARTLAQETPLIIWDEPTSALDLRHQMDALRCLRARVDRGAAALIVVHDLSLAALVADRIVVLRGGAVVADGPPGSVLTAELIRDVYRVPVSVLTGEDNRIVVVPRMDDSAP